MMSQRWRAISARIEGLAQAVQLAPPRDSWSVLKRFGAPARDVLAEIQRFAADFAASLPAGAHALIKEFNDKHENLFAADGGSEPGERAVACIALLVALRSEVAFVMSDHQEAIRSLTERAFQHLRRVLAANASEREVWRKAFTEGGETACERLGAAHLLWHGIYAFKADGERGRTDLVFGEPVRVEEIATAIEGLVLTEWKVATPDTAADKWLEARLQSEDYGIGVLAGVELAGFRYAVVVSEAALDVPADVAANGVVYRHINVAIAPATPSQHARKQVQAIRRTDNQG